jgi:hypothetical protein
MVMAKPKMLIVLRILFRCHEVTNLRYESSSSPEVTCLRQHLTRRLAGFLPACSQESKARNCRSARSDNGFIVGAGMLGRIFGGKKM